jgi:hypothetical protein
MTEAETFLWAHLRRKVARVDTEAAERLREFVQAVDVEPPGDLPSGAGLIRFELRYRLGELSIELDARTAELASWTFPLLRDADGARPSDAEATRLAEAASDPPADAVLASAEWENMGGLDVYVVRWEHHEDGVLVERDYVQVLVSAQSGRTFSVSRRWHTVDENWSER